MKKQPPISEAHTIGSDLFLTAALAIERRVMRMLAEDPNPFPGGCYHCGNLRVQCLFRYNEDTFIEYQERLCYDCKYEQNIGVD